MEFGSTADATAARARLVDFGVLDRVDVKAGPTITETAELTTY